MRKILIIYGKKKGGNIIQKEYKKVYSFTMEDKVNESVDKISLERSGVEGASFEELLTTFRQFIISLGYPDSLARRIILLDDDELKVLGIKVEDLWIYETKY